MKATIVYEKNWKAIHARNPDGTRKFRYIINKGSSRSSKTRSIIQVFWLYAWANTNKRLSVWRNTKKDCKDTVGHDMRQVYPFMPNYKSDFFNKTESIYTIPTLSTIEVRGTDDEEQVMGFNGDVAWLNEPYQISKDTFDQIDQRTADFIIIDWNPKKQHWALDLEKDARTIVIHSTFRDNPFCPREEKIKILSYQPVKYSSMVTGKVMTEAEAKEYNLTDNPAALTEKQLRELARCKENERKGSANAFKWQVYGLGLKAEKPNRIFSWEEISDDDYNKLDATRYYGIDWGTVDPWGILEAKYYDGALYLKELNYQSENEIRATLNPTELQQIQGLNDPDDISSQTGLVKWHIERLGIPKTAVTVCDDNRPLKVRALRTAGWDYAITATKGQGSVIDGNSLLENLKVYYTSSSKNLAYEQENYERQVDRYGIVLEEPEDRDNHLIDPARYIAVFLQINGIIKVI